MRSSRTGSAGGTRRWRGRSTPPACGPRAGSSASSTPPWSCSTPGPGRDFTVQEVVERSGQSLHSFYQYFGGKHELLLALFEESVRTTTEHLGEVIAQEDDPLERLHAFVVEYYRMCRPNVDGRHRWQATGTPGHGRVRPAAAHRAPEGGGPGLLPARVRVRGGPPGGRRRRCRPSRPPPRSDRRHRPRGDHVQHLLLDDRRPVAAYRRGRLRRGPVEPDPPRHRLGRPSAERGPRSRRPAPTRPRRRCGTPDRPSSRSGRPR